jgi:hypothetical protein
MNNYRLNRKLQSNRLKFGQNSFTLKFCKFKFNDYFFILILFIINFNFDFINFRYKDMILN